MRSPRGLQLSGTLVTIIYFLELGLKNVADGDAIDSVTKMCFAKQVIFREQQQQRSNEIVTSVN